MGKVMLLEVHGEPDGRNMSLTSDFLLFAANCDTPSPHHMPSLSSHVIPLSLVLHYGIEWCGRRSAKWNVNLFMNVFKRLPHFSHAWMNCCCWLLRVQVNEVHSSIPFRRRDGDVKWLPRVMNCSKIFIYFSNLLRCCIATGKQAMHEAQVPKLW